MEETRLWCYILSQDIQNENHRQELVLITINIYKAKEFV